MSIGFHYSFPSVYFWITASRFSLLEFKTLLTITTYYYDVDFMSLKLSCIRQSNEFRQSHIPSRFIFAFLFRKHMQMKVSRAAVAAATTVGTTMAMVVCDDLLFSAKWDISKIMNSKILPTNKSTTTN